ELVAGYDPHRQALTAEIVEVPRCLIVRVQLQEAPEVVAGLPGPFAVASLESYATQPAQRLGLVRYDVEHRQVVAAGALHVARLVAGETELVRAQHEAGEVT